MSWLSRRVPVVRSPAHGQAPLRATPPADAAPRTGPRFLLDEGIHPRVAELVWELGLDASSVHDIRRLGLSDWEQLELAAQEGRILVTRNRWDMLHCTTEWCRSGRRHGGVLLVPWSLSNERPERLAHAIKRWAATQEPGADGFGAYHVDFLVP